MRRTSTRLSALTLTLVVLFFGVVPAASAVPTNDDFANRELLTDAVSTLTTVAGATLETNEVLASCSSFDPMDWSVWYGFTAPATGQVNVEASLSPKPNGTNYVAVYELGTTPTAESPGTQVGCTRSQNVTNTTADVIAGKSYAIQFAGKTSDLGDDLTISYSTTGTLSGTVTELGTGNAVPGVTVTVFDTFGTTVQGSDTTAADGTWSVTAPVGDVIVSFTDTSGVYALQYYNGKTTSFDADELAVTTGSSTTDIDAALEGAGTITGTITDTDGAPIDGALVTIYDAPSPGGPVKLGFTDTNGDYSLELLPAGNYYIKFSAPGFFTEWFDEQPDYTTATTVQLQAGQVRTFDEDLAGEGSINGVITDDLGDGVQTVIVKIYPASAGPGDPPVATGTSNNLGSYLSNNPLPAGDYKVFADTFQALDGKYGSEWWDDKTSFAASDTITLGSGETFLADFSLQRTIVRGVVTSDADGLAVGGVTVTLTDSNSDQIGQVLTNASGEYEFVRVPTVDSPLTLTFDGASVAHGTDTQSGPISAGDVQVVDVTLASVPKAPAIGSGGLSASVAEEQSVGVVVTTLTATDQNRTDTLTWSITAGNAGGAFTIGSATGAISTAKVLDYETTPSYSLTVEVSDGTFTDSVAVSVSVTDVNDPPVMGSGGLSASVAEDVAVGTVVTTLTATDPDSGSLTWSITGGNAGGAFAIDASSGVVSTAQGLDYETTPSYSLTVEVSDGGLSDTVQVQVTVTDVNETPPVTGPNVERLFGSNRYRTGVAVSSDRFPGTSSVVFIATGANFPDALVAAAPAGNLDAPVLLVAQNSVDSAVMTELQRLSPSKIYVVGGSAVISDSVAATLGAVAPVTRLSGSNRYSTAVNVSKEFYDSSTSSVFIATGSSFPDALVGAAPAARDGSPILLVPKDSVPSNVLAELVRLSPSKIYVLGGTAVVSSSVESTLGGIAPVTRLAGSDRFGTADAVATALFPTAGGTSSAYLATAYNFPDALVAAAAAGKEGGPVLLTAKDSLTSYADRQIRRLKPADVFIIGGTAVVSDTVMNAVDW